LRRQAGELAFPLSALEAELGLRTLSLGGRLYLFPQPSRFNSVLKTAKGVRFLLSDFSPVSLEPVSEGLELTFYNVEVALASRRWSWTQGLVRSVTMRVDEAFHRAHLTLRVSSPFDYTFARSETPSGFALALRVTAAGSPSAQPIRLDEGIHYAEAWTAVGAGAALTHTVRIDHARALGALDVALPQEGVGHLEPLDRMARREGALVAINANFFDPASRHPIGLLIRDGQLEADDYAGRGALLVDRAGRIRLGRFAADPVAVVNGTTLPIDAVNRPPKEHELALITPQYGRLLRLGQPVTLARIRDGAIRSLQRSQIVPSGSNDAVLAVPDGLLARIGPLRVGQRIRLAFRVRFPAGVPPAAPSASPGTGRSSLRSCPPAGAARA